MDVQGPERLLGAAKGDEVHAAPDQHTALDLSSPLGRWWPLWAGDIAAGAHATTPWADAADRSERIGLPGVVASTAALLVGAKWSSGPGIEGAITSISYSFATAQSIYSYSDLDLAQSLSPLNQQDRATVRAALASIEAVARVRFVEVSDTTSEVGVIRYAYSTKPAELRLSGLGFYPSAQPSGGDVWLTPPQATTDSARAKLILHETLHAIGLKHPFDGDVVLPKAENIIPNTVMSYSPVPGAAGGAMTSMPTEPMPLDILALQQLYGAAKTNASDTVYDLAEAGFRAGFRSIWDAGGSDTFDASSLGAPVHLNLVDGARSKIGVTVVGVSYSTFERVTYDATVSIAVGTVIENAIGTRGADTIIGNAAGNWIDGGGGDDTIEGGGGTDVAIFHGSRAEYKTVGDARHASVTCDADRTVVTLSGVERLQFNDIAVALDLDGGAGLVARLIGAIYGAAALADTGLVGAGLRLLAHGRSPLELAQAGLADRLGGVADAAASLDLLVGNIAGRPPTQAEKAQYLNPGGDTAAAAQLAVLASELPDTIAMIDLVGLQLHGLAYAP